MEIATLIVNRNDPIRTDALVESIQRVSKKPRDIFVLESGSDIGRMSKYASVWYKENVNWPLGFNLLAEYASHHKMRQAGKKYDAFWMVCNDTQLIDQSDILQAMEDVVTPWKRWGVAHPYQSFFGRDHVGFPLNKKGNDGRKVSFVEFVCPLINAQFYWSVSADGMFPGPIDQRYSRGWGIDYEMAYYAYKHDWDIVNIDRVGVLHIPNTSHNNHLQTKTEPTGVFLHTAREEMLKEMVKKHGRDWGAKFCAVIPDLPDQCFRKWSVGDRATSLQMPAV